MKQLSKSCNLLLMKNQVRKNLTWLSQKELNWSREKYRMIPTRTNQNQKRKYRAKHTGVVERRLEPLAILLLMELQLLVQHVGSHMCIFYRHVCGCLVFIILKVDLLPLQGPQLCKLLLCQATNLWLISLMGEEIREITRIHQAETKVVLREVPNTITTFLKIRSCEFVFFISFDKCLISGFWLLKGPLFWDAFELWSTDRNLAEANSGKWSDFPNFLLSPLEWKSPPFQPQYHKQQ